MKRERRTEGGRLFEGEPRREVQDELEFHIEQRVREFMAGGMDEETARRTALERIGDFERVRGECAGILVSERRALARRDWLSDLLQDIRYAMRGAARAPLFTVMAVITLALGIGANSAVFGVLKSVLLDALPYHEPDRLVRVIGRFDTAPDVGGPLSAGSVTDVVERQSSFVEMAASVSNIPDAVLRNDEGATTVRLAWVQPHFFDVLGVRPVRGRTFDATDAEMDTARALVITHRVWQERFGGGDVLGQTLTLNGIPRTVIGVLPQGFVHPMRDSNYFLPLNMAPLLQDPVGLRGSHYLELVGRLAPGVPLTRAQAEVGSIGEALAAEHPRDNTGIRLEAQPLHEDMMGDTRTPLLVLMASAALVLLIACANLAAALLSRTIARRKEFAVRISLGAGRGRLVRQLLAESVLLAVVGGAIGVLLAHVALAALRGANLEALPEYATLSLDGGALVFTFVLALLTGAAFGSMPALTVVHTDPQPVLRDESRGASESRGAGRLRGLLVAGQVALCLSLLAGAGLLTRSLWLMASAPLGFEADDVLTFGVPLSGARYAQASSQVAFRDEIAEQIAALPGVEGVAATTFLPTLVSNSNGVVVIGAEQSPGETPPFILTNGVSENYFDVMGIPVSEGRTFTTADHMESVPVAVVSETMARRFWPNGGALGSRIRVGPNPESTPIEVIGIVRDVRTSLTEAQPEPMLYRPLRQGWFGHMFVVRTAGNPLGHVSSIRTVLSAYDAALPMADVATLRDVLSEGLAARRLPMLLMVSFGVLALLLACIGIYALFANMALAREREFGVRLALGATPRTVGGLLLRQGALWMAIGLAGGALGIFAVSRALSSLVYGIAPLDSVSIGAAVAALLLSAIVALAVPLRRAVRSDPLAVMR